MLNHRFDRNAEYLWCFLTPAVDRLRDPPIWLSVSTDGLDLRFVDTARRFAGLRHCVRDVTLDGVRLGEISPAVKSSSFSASAPLFHFGLITRLSSFSECAISAALACSPISLAALSASPSPYDASLFRGSCISSSQGKCCVPSSTHSIAALTNRVCSLSKIAVSILQ